MENVLFNIKKLQQERFQHTYKDFLSQDKYASMAHFFFHQIYCLEDTTARDEDFNKLYNLMLKVLGAKKIQSVTKLKELNELAKILDSDIACIYQRHFISKPFSLEMLKKCYQIQLKDKKKINLRMNFLSNLIESTQFFHKLSKFPFISLIIQPTKIAAKQLHIEHLMDFFLSGYYAFKEIKRQDMIFFLNQVDSQEKKYLASLM